MTAPLCRLCGHHHWSTEPHQFKKATAPAPAKKAKKGKAKR